MSQKYCPKCETEKDISEFGPNKSRKDGVQSFCKACRPSYMKQWYDKETSQRREVANASRNIKRSEYRAKIKEYLRNHPCIDCGNSDIEVLEFDHKDASTKLFAIGENITKGLGWDRIFTEMKKCDVRCANCHRKKTRRQLGWWIDDEVA